MRVNHAADDVMTDPVGRARLACGCEHRYGYRTAPDDPGWGSRENPALTRLRPRAYACGRWAAFAGPAEERLVGMSAWLVVMLAIGVGFGMMLHGSPALAAISRVPRRS
jgi:hypothetical protein